MAITENTKLQMSVFARFHGQLTMNVWYYNVSGTFSGIGAAAVAEAWWQHVKAAYRGLVDVAFSTTFEKVLCVNVSESLGEYGEYSIPTAERVGTRVVAGAVGMPPFVAAGARLAVGTRTTRPGQKRFGWVLESDSSGPSLGSEYITLANALLAKAAAQGTLGAPALGMILDPIVARLDPTSGLVTAWQNVTGYTVNPTTTSQVSRKMNRGA